MSKHLPANYALCFVWAQADLPEHTPPWTPPPPPTPPRHARHETRYIPTRHRTHLTTLHPPTLSASSPTPTASSPTPPPCLGAPSTSLPSGAVGTGGAYKRHGRNQHELMTRARTRQPGSRLQFGRTSHRIINTIALYCPSNLTTWPPTGGYRGQPGDGPL